MATTRFAFPDRFPPFTTVSVYRRSDQAGADPLPSRQPSGSVVTATQVDDEARLTLTGLDPDTRYVAYALVEGKHSLLSFATDADTPPTATASAVSVDPIGIITGSNVQDALEQIAAALASGGGGGAPLTPVNTVAPAVTGTAQTGQTLTCSTGTWIGASPITYSYQWKRAGGVIPGQTGVTYLLDPASDEGVAISCTVTAINSEGSASADSNTVVPTAPALSYLLRDDFTSDEPAPLTSPRTSEPGPGHLTLIDTATGADASISGGRYLRPKVTSGGAYTTYGAVSVESFERLPGLTGYAKAQFGSLDRVTPIAFNNAASLVQGPINFTVGTGSVAIIDANASFNVAPTLAINTDYQFAIVLRGNGALYLIRGGVYTAWTLLYVGACDKKRTLYAMTSNNNADAKHDQFAIVQKGDALAREFGKCAAFNPIPAAGDTRTGVADGHSYFTWTVGSAEVLSMYFRRTDDNNTYRIDCDQAAGTIKLYRRVAGVDTELDAGKTQTWTVDGVYRIGVVFAADAIRTFVSDAANATTAKHSVTGESFNLTTAGGKVAGFAAGSNWEAWPYTFSGTDLESLA